MTWIQLDMIQTPPIVTTDFVYVRFRGDRSISEKDIGTILKDRSAEISRWAKKLREVQEHEHDVKTAMVAANNHCARYGHETSNIFRDMLGLKRVTWGEEKDSKEIFEFEEIEGHRSRAIKQTNISS